jgi:hypothetical protein
MADICETVEASATDMVAIFFDHPASDRTY